MKYIPFLFGLVLIFFAFCGFSFHVIKKVIEGNGLEYYFTGFGYKFNYLGALILLVLLATVLIAALFIRWYQMRDEKSFKDKYLD